MHPLRGANRAVLLRASFRFLDKLAAKRGSYCQLLIRPTSSDMHAAVRLISGFSAAQGCSPLGPNTAPHLCVRSTRNYTVPDPPGLFDGHVWPMYLKHRKEMEDNGVDVGKALQTQSLWCYTLDIKEGSNVIKAI